MSNKQEGIIVINAGSSSLKFKVFLKDTLKEVIFGQVSGIGTIKTKLVIKSAHDRSVLKESILDQNISRDDIVSNLIDYILEAIPDINIVIAGHRVVHGGTEHIKPEVITKDVINSLKDIIPLAPLHLPHNIMPMEVLLNKLPNIKQVACYDTAFHSTNPMYTRYYAIPRKLIEDDKIMRYGFHGLSYEFITETLKELDKDLYSKKVIVCHLGAGASISAIENGVGFTTTMGFTALEGVPMGTRTGDIDPGVLLYLMKYKNYNYDDLEKLLYHESGMLGLSEESSDFYIMETSQKEKTKEAWHTYKYNVAKKVGSIMGAMGGVDGIVFTAGLGENAPEVREYIADKFAFLGIKLDKEANDKNALVITTKDSKVKMMVIPTNEELVIAQHATKLIK